MRGHVALTVLAHAATVGLWTQAPAWLRLALLTLNGISFLVWSWDKVQAQAGRARVSEAVLHALNLLGVAGATVARVAMRHKTLKSGFSLSALAGVLALLALCGQFA